MKQIKTFKFLMMAVCAVMCVTFAACGGDDDKDDISGDYQELKEGVHRIEVYFSGSDKWRVVATFLATHGYGGTDLYENGQKVNKTAGGYYSEELRNYAVETGKNCDQMVATIQLDPLSKSTSGDIEVTLKGFIDGKQTNMKVWTVKADAPKTLVFYCQDIGADLIQ
ncbi:MAG: beta-barrel fold lipoprotein [Prevotella sp.]|nr:beta-barrel fold lipoprotein [Prevotella sp.]